MDHVRLQFRRIKEHEMIFHSLQEQKRLLRDLEDENPHRNLIDQISRNETEMVADIHYLLISISMVRKLWICLEKELGNPPELSDIKSKYWAIIENYYQRRGELEHIYARIKNPSGLKIFHSGTELSINGQAVDISQKAEKTMVEIFSKIQSALRRIAVRTDTSEP